MVCLLAAAATQVGAVPTRHVISGVPWHQQMNGLFCGAASLEMVLDYWGPDQDQKAVADVARSSSMGTWCYDILRTGHFSLLSEAQGSFFPNAAPSEGFPNQPLGLASFGYAAQEIWLDQVKALLAADIPVIMLMYYAPDGTGGGHYRVAIGYDDALGVMYFNDPWGRDMRYLPDQPGVIAWSYADVASAWNYVAYGTPLPYYGVAMMPWKVDVSVKGKVKVGSTLTVTAQIQYPCPAPFNTADFPAGDTQTDIALPAGLTLLSSETLSLGTVAAGSARTVSWQVRADRLPTAGAAIDVWAHGLVSGSMPEADWEGVSQSYPPYSYTDLIGGSGSFRF